MEFLTSTAGWIGTGLVVIAYFLVSHNKVSSTGRTYQLLNLFGAIGVGANVLYTHAWPSFALQAIWACISITALIFTVRKTK